MDPRDKIISALAERTCRRLSRAVVGTLQKMTEGMQSGHDTGLKSIWDEVCVQVQGQESAMWEAYLDTIRSVIAKNLLTVNPEAKQAIWLQTNNGLEWKANEGDEDAPFADDDLTGYILDRYVISTAADWTNARIERFNANSLKIG